MKMEKYRIEIQEYIYLSIFKFLKKENENIYII